MPKPTSSWPILKSYDADHLARIALPLGGIGTGTISLGGRGNLLDFEVANRPAKGFTPPQTFFALYVKAPKVAPITRALEGPIPPSQYEGGFGASVPNHGLPRFRRCSFDAAYPLGQVHLSDPDVPVAVTLQAFNPLIPGDADASGIPVAILRFNLTNRTRQTLAASICGTLTNFLGQDGKEGRAVNNSNIFRVEPSAQGLLLRCGTEDCSAATWGSMALATTATTGITHRTAWAKRSWGDSLLDFWDDFSADGRLEERERGEQNEPQASLAAAVKLPPRANRAITFLIAWHFPNRLTWAPKKKEEKPKAAPAGGCCQDGSCGQDPDYVGNYYATQYRDAWDVAARTVPQLPALEAKTVHFVRAFCASDLPEVVKEAALFNVSTLRSQTSFRVPSGHLLGWEGCGDKDGCCSGSCTHVWNYEHTTAFLFADLARSMREVEFVHTLGAHGHLGFRAGLPLGTQDWPLAAADGQMGCLMKLYREWQLSGDEAFLQRLYPNAKKALEFCWIKGGWDADQDGVMEGCQHNTMDVEYYGPNPQMTGWYLGALRAMEEIARHLCDTPFAAKCRRLFDSGSAWMDQHLFNEDYYEQHIIPPKSEADIAPGLRHETMGARNLADPELQIGAGCLIDQLVGQYTAHVCGLGYLHDPAKVRTALRSIMKHNYRSNFFSHFNHLRTFVLNDEAALLMCSYPRGRRPARPFPYYNEVMTGFEYTAAIGMLYEGDLGNGLKAIASIRQRYDGRKRSPFNEAECGHHYARAMAAWAAVLALTGFHYSAVTGALSFALPKAKKAMWFFSTGSAWGTITITRKAKAAAVTLTVLHGFLKLNSLSLTDFATTTFDATLTVPAGTPLRFTLTP